MSDEKEMTPIMRESVRLMSENVRLTEQLNAARAEITELHEQLEDSFPRSWDGLMAFVDYQYPRDIFTDSDDQPGSRIVWLLRRLAEAEAEIESLAATGEGK